MRVWTTPRHHDTIAQGCRCRHRPRTSRRSTLSAYLILDMRLNNRVMVKHESLIESSSLQQSTLHTISSRFFDYYVFDCVMWWDCTRVREEREIVRERESHCCRHSYLRKLKTDSKIEHASRARRVPRMWYIGAHTHLQHMIPSKVANTKLTARLSFLHSRTPCRQSFFFTRWQIWYWWSDCVASFLCLLTVWPIHSFAHSRPWHMALANTRSVILFNRFFDLFAFVCV